MSQEGLRKVPELKSVIQPPVRIFQKERHKEAGGSGVGSTMRWQNSAAWRERAPALPGAAQTGAAGADILGRTQECDMSICMFLVLKRMTESVTNQICGPV